MNSSLAQSPPFLATEDPCYKHPPNEFTHMGFSMRTQDYRYTEWVVWRCTDPAACTNVFTSTTSADWSDLAGVELYSHHGDDGSCFDCFEGVNLAGRPEYAQLAANLSKQLRAGWEAARPGAALHRTGAGAGGG